MSQHSPAGEPEYLVTTSRDGEVTEQRMPRSAVLALDPDDVDFHCDEAFGRIQIRQSRGEPAQHPAEIPRIGPVRRKVLLVVMNRPGEYLSPRQLATLTGYPWLRDPRNVAGCIRSMRRAFGETGSRPFYFLTRRSPYAVAWCAGRSWRHIEAVLLPLNGGSEHE